MNPKTTFARDSAPSKRTSAEETLRETLQLLAQLPVPEGLEARVQARVNAGLRSAPQKASLLSWPQRFTVNGNWMHGAAMRAAAAAAIVCIVLGGGWGILSHVRIAQPANAIAQPPRPSAAGGFSSAGAMRTPQTLKGPVVAPSSSAPQQSDVTAIEKAADKTAAKPSMKISSGTAQSHLHASRSNGAGKTASQSTTTQTK